ncbi:tetratricopeptide repeat protein [Sorangium sp. So ce1036]|uniref:tetratricopeptide repeat protein n=1 Tax=Sorangium sp. So ce1036 TaxID=3133328 RepID=UPI003F0D48D2
MKRRLPDAVLAALLALAAPLAAASCGDEATPPPRAPTHPAGPGAAAPPGLAPYGMSDAPSSMRPYDQPAQGAHPAMNARAAALYQSGLQAFAIGDLASARALFSQATQADPRAHQAFYSLGVVQERLRDSGAGASYRQAFTIVPDYEPAIIAYAMLLARKDQLGEAERLLNEKRGQVPKSAAITATLAEIESLQRDTGSAQRLAQEALKINPDYRPAMVIIARDHYRNRRLDLALYALQAILDGFEPVSENPPRDRDNAEALLLRGLIYREQGQRAAAMEEFRKAVARRPDLVEARVQLATFLLEAGNAQEALPLLEGAIRFDAEHLAAHLNLGDAYRLLERYVEAKREFDWVLARNPNLPQVHYDLGLLYLFAPSVPGMTPKQQVTAAIQSLTKFQELRNKGQRDDSEELLNRAKLKQGELEAAAAAAQPVAPAPPAAAADGGVVDAATDTGGTP